MSQSWVPWGAGCRLLSRWFIGKAFGVDSSGRKRKEAGMSRGTSRALMRSQRKTQMGWNSGYPELERAMPRYLVLRNVDWIQPGMKQLSLVKIILKEGWQSRLSASSTLSSWKKRPFILKEDSTSQHLPQDVCVLSLWCTLIGYIRKYITQCPHSIDVHCPSSLPTYPIHSCYFFSFPEFIELKGENQLVISLTSKEGICV